MERRVLKNKPLTEAIFEVKWEVAPAPTANQLHTNLPADPHFTLLLGRFFERVQEQYPAHEPLPTSQIPAVMIPHTPQHRFRVDSNSWPLIQIGQGIMTVNETEAYTWTDFQKRCEDGLTQLYESLPAGSKFEITELALGYINAIDVDFAKESVFEFLQNKMKTRISMHDELFKETPVQSNPEHCQIDVAFPATKPAGRIALKFAMGERNQVPAVIVQTRVFSPRELLPAMPEKFNNWLSQAHDLTDEWFFRLIDGELLERFI